jgi:hypothetical protein
MASVFKRQEQPNWYARFMIGGRDYCSGREEACAAVTESERNKIFMETPFS